MTQCTGFNLSSAYHENLEFTLSFENASVQQMPLKYYPNQEFHK